MHRQARSLLKVKNPPHAFFRSRLDDSYRPDSFPALLLPLRFFAEIQTTGF